MAEDELSFETMLFGAGGRGEAAPVAVAQQQSTTTVSRSVGSCAISITVTHNNTFVPSNSVGASPAATPTFGPAPTQSPHITFSLHSPVFSPRSTPLVSPSMTGAASPAAQPFSSATVGSPAGMGMPPILTLGGNGNNTGSSGNGNGRGEPNCTVVLKNLPFYMKQDVLYQTLARAGVPPHHIGMHYDGNGMFRGMAFIKYHTIAEATKAVELIPTVDFGGRRIKCEFKNKKANSVPVIQDEGMRKIWDELVALRESDKHMILRKDLTRDQLKQIRYMADRLQLQLVVPITGGIRFV
eukprot:TRINITY_DN3620_c0_g1_i1.p1 TRINITY_DN3620_c0_g1~~TRINITY_DN3620_c0_g1_i1.p1  ORF type:complete len:304 (-),score=81.61 TRINITY_DN3620_c0_g1_i1:539-1429(-)